MNKFDEIPFQPHPVRICRTLDGDIGKVRVNDLCAALNRTLLVRDGTALRKCPSLEILDAERPRDLYAPLDEAVGFVQWMARGSKLLRERSRELLQTLQQARRIPDPGITAEQRTQKVPEPETLTLEYAGNRFTMRRDGGRCMVNATEMARPFDKRPAVWLKLVETIRLRQTLVGNGTLPDQQNQVITSRGPSGATWLEIHLCMQFAEWLSPPFGAWCSEKLASLLRNGNIPLDGQQRTSDPEQAVAYTVEPVQPLPANYEDALALIESQQQTIRTQNEFINSNRYKYEHYRQTIEDREWFSTTMIANELGISAISLNLFLMEEGVQRRVRDEWAIEPQYRHLRDIHIYEWYNHRTRYTNKYKIDGWTPHGREYIVELWTKRNG